MADPTPFRARLALISAGWSDILTVPAGKFAQFTTAQASNIDGTNSVDVSLQWLDPGAVATSLAFLVRVAGKDAASLIAPGLMLTAGDKLQGRASVDGDAVITVSGFYQDMP